MATYDGHQIPLAEPAVFAGAGFTLSTPAPIDFQFQDASFSGHLVAGSHICLINLFVPVARAELLDFALERAQQTLDLDGARDGRFLALPDAYTDYFLWWRESNGTRALLSTSSHMSVHVSAAATIIRADGTQEQVSSPVPTWAHAMRLLRFSQNTKDLFESYRYVFLAVESALDSKWPKNLGEAELHWFRRCNRELAIMGLDFKACGGTTGDPVEDFSRSQYESFRCALFHGKATRGTFLPGGSGADRRLVVGALAGLGEYLRGVFQYGLATPIYSGGITIAGVQSLVGTFKDELIIAVTEDDSPPHVEDVDASPKGLPVSELPTHYLGVVDGIGYEHEFAAELPVTAMKSPVIKRTVTKLPAALLTAGEVYDLQLEGFDVLEARHRWHLAKRWGNINARFEY